MTTKKTTTKRTTKKATGIKPKAATNAGAKKMSALHASAKVLGESKEPLNAKTMIERMAA